MLASSNGLGTLTFNQCNVGSTPIASTKFYETPFDDDIWYRIQEVVPYPGFFSSVQENGGYVAGGFARYVLGISPLIKCDDIDIFCVGTPESYQKMKEVFVTNPWHPVLKKNVMYKENRRIPYHTLDTNVTDAHYQPYVYAGKVDGPRNKFQFIYDPTHATMTDVLEDFDISVCCFYLDFFKEKVLYHPGSYQDEIDKNLRIRKLKNIMPLNYIEYRLQKYLEKGYKLYLEEVFKIQELVANHPEYNEYVSNNIADWAVEKWEASFHIKEEFDKLKGITDILKIPENLLS